MWIGNRETEFPNSLDLLFPKIHKLLMDWLKGFAGDDHDASSQPEGKTFDFHYWTEMGDGVINHYVIVEGKSLLRKIHFPQAPEVTITPILLADMLTYLVYLQFDPSIKDKWIVDGNRRILNPNWVAPPPSRPIPA